MRSRRSSDAAWSEAAARRLAQLTADLGGPAAEPPDDDWWGDHTRVVRRDVPDAPPAPARVPEPTPLPRPGRHASRRRGVGWRPPVPVLPALGSSHLAVVALLAAAGLAVTAWWVARGSAEPVRAVPVAEASPLVAQPSSTAAAVPSAEGSPGSPSGTASEAAGEVTVDVTGRVRRPGIVVLDEGARVVDAVKAAGGARPGVDLTSLNLARLLVDGEQIVVGQTAPAAPAVPSATSTSAGPATLVNLNTATETELESLPEVGPVTAQAIIGWRDEHGGFTSVDELLEVDGIGEATLAQISPYVTV